MYLFYLLYWVCLLQTCTAAWFELTQLLTCVRSSQGFPLLHKLHGQQPLRRDKPAVIKVSVLQRPTFVLTKRRLGPRSGVSGQFTCMVDLQSLFVAFLNNTSSPLVPFCCCTNSHIRAVSFSRDILPELPTFITAFSIITQGRS